MEGGPGATVTYCTLTGERAFRLKLDEAGAGGQFGRATARISWCVSDSRAGAGAVKDTLMGEKFSGLQSGADCKGMGGRFGRATE